MRVGGRLVGGHGGGERRGVRLVVGVVGRQLDLVAHTTVDLFGEVAEYLRAHGRHGDGEERTGDAEQAAAGGHREDHDGGVQAQSAPLQERLEEVPLDLLHSDDQDQDAERDAGPLDHQRDEDRERAGHQSTDDGDERAEEREHREGTASGTRRSPARCR